MPLENARFSGFTLSIAKLLVPAILLAALLSQPALSQEADSVEDESKPAGDIEEIVITGSMLRRDDPYSSSPISVISLEELLESGSLSLTEALKRDVTMGPNSRGETLTINGGGASNVNLRNLGSNRTLALVNGKRLPLFSDIIGNSGVDTSIIPSMMIQRVEVLRDGASTMYGSDAVAGVVNFILREEYDGMQVDASYGISDEGDGNSYRVSAMFGKTFDRGSIIVSGIYQDQEPIPMSDRDFTNPIVQSLAPLNDNTYGSPFTPGGTVFGPGPLSRPPVACYDFEFGSIPNNPANPACPRYDYAAESSLIQGSTLEGIGVIARYDITESIRIRADVFQSRRESYTGFTGFGSAQINTTSTIGPIEGGFSIPASNSNNPYGVAVRLRWRPSTYGLQDTNTTSNVTYMTLGLDGTVLDRFDWDISYTESDSDADSTTSNLINAVAFFNLLNPASCAANPTCASAGAIPNIADLLKGDTPLTTRQQDYLFVDSSSNNYFKTSQAIAQIAGEVFELPAGTAQLALGFEHREEEVKMTPDYMTQSGELVGRFVFPTEGDYYTNEVFGELDLPLMADQPGVRELTLNLQARYSDFSNFGGADTYKAGLSYSPVDSVRFRGGYGTSFRAPDLMDLYRGGAGGGAALNDPCNASGLRATNAQVDANCVALGVPADFSQPSPGSLQIARSGNPGLQPETGVSKTIGIVFQPTSLPQFSMSVDYYDIEIEDAIGAGNAQLALNSCYADPNLIALSAIPESACFGYANRFPEGSLDRIPVKSINIEELSTTGVDMNMTYAQDELGFIPGGLQAQLGVSKQLTFESQGRDLMGTFNGGVDGSNAYPDVRAALSVTYLLTDVDVQWGVDYIDSVQDLNYGTSIPVDNFLNYSGVPSYQEHRLLFRWRPMDRTTVSLGINNLFDKEPPFALVVTRNSIATLHDQIGRYYFVRYVQEF